MSGRFWMHCIVCGEDVLESDADGLFVDGDSAPCPGCGVISWVTCDAESPAESNTDEIAADIGQPRCDNECGNVYLASDACRRDFVGSPCYWDCPKTLAWRAIPAALHQPPRDLSAVHPVRDHDGRRIDDGS